MPPTRRDWQRWASRGSTEQRGYGHSHQRLLQQRRAQWRPGDPCAHCGQPIAYLWYTTPAGRRVSMADLPHNPSRTGYLPGLAHRYCNRSDGARRGNQQRGQAKRWAAARRW